MGEGEVVTRCTHCLARHVAPDGWPGLSGWTATPLRRASDRAEAWIRISLLTVFLIAGPLVGLGAVYWA